PLTPEPATGLQLPPKRAQAPKPSRPFAPGAFSNRGPDDEATRLHPIEITAASRGARLKLPESDDALRPSADNRGSAPSASAAEHFSAPLMMEAVPVAPPQPPPGMSLPGMAPIGVPPGISMLVEAPPGGAPQGAAQKASGGGKVLPWLRARWHE